MASSYEPQQHAAFPQPPFSSPRAVDITTSAQDSELQCLRSEHVQLMQTHQAFQADLRELREVRAEVRELVQVAQSLRADLSQARGQNLSPAQPSASQLSSPPVKQYESTTAAEDGNFAELPPPPWPEPDVDLIMQMENLTLSDMGATTYQPVVPGPRKFSLLLSQLHKYTLLSLMPLMLVDFLLLLHLKSFRSSPFILGLDSCTEDLLLRSLSSVILIRVRTWIRSNNHCWRCARGHHAAQCDLKKPCNICQGTHLRPLHEVNVNPSHKEDSANVEKSCPTNSSPDRFFLDKPSVGGRVMLKVVPVNLHYEDHTLDTFALLDDGSERTILLSTAVKALGIQGVPEELPFWTVRDDIQVLNGSSISFQISPLCKPQTCYKINHAFTAEHLNLSRQSYPVEQIQQKYGHLRGLPIRTLTDVQPLLLIGSDQPHLITPTEPVRWGGPGTPAAVHTRLGWTIQGPIPPMGWTPAARQCLLTSMAPQGELFQNVQWL
ncbi:hypothetical protein QTP86_022921 [Hemibagrus guttatus]|nr:hypothetical protein QTP86_022921 [Hemibagrus guttatus]